MQILLVLLIYNVDGPMLNSMVLHEKPRFHRADWLKYCKIKSYLLYSRFIVFTIWTAIVIRFITYLCNEVC